MRHKRFLACAAASSALISSPAIAQPAAESPTSAEAQAEDVAVSEPVAATSGEAEIFVTANRRAENVQRVPLSIAVLNNEDLTAAGISAPEQLTQRTTNVQMGNINAQPLIYIRGMGSANLNAGAEGTVGLYMDGVYLPWAISIDQNFLDIERVEVLKGPQGSLYGRNTTAGAINFITRDPSRERAAEMTLTLGTWGTQNLSAYVASGPGEWSASLAGQITRHNPYLRNLGTGPDYQDRDEFGFRGKIQYEPSDRFMVTLSADYLHGDDFNGMGFLSVNERPTAADPANPAPFTTIDRNPNFTYGDFPSLGRQIEDVGGNLRIRADLGFAEFVSITAARHTQLDASVEVDISELSLSAFSSNQSLESQSQEFQLISSGESNFQWVLGLYGFHSKGGFERVGVWNPRTTPYPSGEFEDADLIVGGIGEAEAYAAYGQASYTFAERFKITAGLRYSWEKRSLPLQYVSIPGLGEVFREQPLDQSWDSLTPKIGIDYTWDRHMLYASYTEGFRSGSYNLVNPGTPGPVNPETVKAFEFGGKHTLARGVRFNWALFHTEYRDLQVSRELNTGQGSLFFVQNAASATIQGAEADLTITAVENLDFNLGVGYLDAEYDDFPNAGAFVPAPGGFGYISAGVDASGLPLARAPQWTASVAATYTIPIGESRLDLSGNVYYTDDYFLDSPSNVEVDSFILVNARATYFLPGDHISVSAFVTNMFNVRYLATLSTSAYALFGTPNDPRIIGASVSLRY